MRCSPENHKQLPTSKLGPLVSLLGLPSGLRSMDGLPGAEFDAASMPNHRFWLPQMTTSAQPPRVSKNVIETTSRQRLKPAQISGKSVNKKLPRDNRLQQKKRRQRRHLQFLSGISKSETEKTLTFMILKVNDWLTDLQKPSFLTEQASSGKIKKSAKRSAPNNIDIHLVQDEVAHTPHSPRITPRTKNKKIENKIA